MKFFIFAATMFLSASLLFVVQPMIGKMLLPNLGGSAGVWTTCLLFFQTVLLLGYVYAHLITKRFSIRTVSIIHLVLALSALPLSLISIRWVGDISILPVLSILMTLTLSIGLPFFVVSSSAPLLQFLFSTTDAPSADDPYHLYVASNFGSLGALICYPVLIEPTIGLNAQTWLWAGTYCAYFLGLLFCFSLTKKPKIERLSDVSITRIRRLKWVLWGFIPSSLMVGVTEFISTDIAPIPLLWLAPLSLYLVTFIIAFSNKFGKVLSLWPLVFLLTLLIPAFKISLPIERELFVHYVVFFLIALHFHGRLADDRPSVGGLTEFFVLLSIGGVLGGVFNGVLSPFLFTQKLEYNLALILAVFCIVPIYSVLKPNQSRSIVSAALLGILVGCVGAYSAGFEKWYLYAIIPLPIVLYGMMQVQYKVGEALSAFVGVIIIVIGFATTLFENDDLDQARSFYSTYRVIEGQHHGRKTIKLYSGGTAHGEEHVDFPGKPFAYYAKESCFGEVMDRPFKNVGVVGLGAGAAAAYATEDSQFDFFEIDDAVVRLARKHFNYLPICGDRCKVKVGDGRRLLENELDGRYDLIVLDAYNSDAVPTHLMTVEAIRLYRAKLKPGGVIAFHVSSRYLALEEVVSSNVKTLGWEAVTKECKSNAELEKVGPILSSRWVVVGAKNDLSSLSERGWTFMETQNQIWTDDYSNISAIFRGRIQ